MESTNIYEISMVVLEYLIEEITEYTQGRVKALERRLVSILATDDNTILKKVLSDLEIEDIDINYLKKVMMLSIASSSYLMASHEKNVDLDLEANELILTFLKNHDAKDIIDYFKKDEEVCYLLLDYIIDFVKTNYLYKAISKEILFKNDEVYDILKINPFFILDISNYKETSKWSTAEVYIEKGLDVYSKAIEEENNKYDEELDSSDEEYQTLDEMFDDSTFVSIFINILKDTFGNDSDNFIKYILSNIYEEGTLKKHDRYAQISYEFITDELDKVEDEESLKRVVNKFYNDADFAMSVIDSFIEINTSIPEGELAKRRRNYKKCGDVLKLKRLNPCFEEEEKRYKQK